MSRLTSAATCLICSPQPIRQHQPDHPDITPPLKPVQLYFAASADSMAWVTSAESGFTGEAKRFRILPSRPTTNLVKFQPILPGKGEPSPASSTYSGWRLGPLTSS